MKETEIVLIYPVQFSKMQMSSQWFFKDFVHRFGTTYQKNGFLWNLFSKILLIDFGIATNLKTGLSKKSSRKILSIDFKTLQQK